MSDRIDTCNATEAEATISTLLARFNWPAVVLNADDVEQAVTDMAEGVDDEDVATLTDAVIGGAEWRSLQADLRAAADELIAEAVRVQLSRRDLGEL